MEHADALKFFLGNEVELLLDIGCKTVIDDLLEMVGKKIGDKFTYWGGQEFAFGGTSFFFCKLARNGGILMVSSITFRF